MGHGRRTAYPLFLCGPLFWRSYRWTKLWPVFRPHLQRSKHLSVWHCAIYKKCVAFDLPKSAAHLAPSLYVFGSLNSSILARRLKAQKRIASTKGALGHWLLQHCMLSWLQSRRSQWWTQRSSYQYYMREEKLRVIPTGLLAASMTCKGTVEWGKGTHEYCFITNPVEMKDFTCGLRVFLWCKYSHHGQCQGTDVRPF